MLTDSDMIQLKKISDKINNTLKEKGVHYGDSWKKRGGPGAYMVTARKMDRIEQIVAQNGYDIFRVMKENPGGALDDIEDLVGYLMLWLLENEKSKATGSPRPGLPRIEAELRKLQPTDFKGMTCKFVDQGEDPGSDPDFMVIQKPALYQFGGATVFVGGIAVGYIPVSDPRHPAHDKFIDA